MSYEKVRKIRITSDKVYITSCSNNVWPQTYEEWESPHYSAILVDKGREELEKELLFSYFEGMKKGLSNDKYQRAVNRFMFKLSGDHHELWKRCGSDPEFDKAFKQQLYDEFKNPPAKKPCCLERKDGWRFARETTQRYIFKFKKGRIFPNTEEAEYALKCTGLGESGFRVVIL